MATATGDTETLFDEMLRYVGFALEDELALASLQQLVEDGLPDLVDRFYRQVDMHRSAREVFTDPTTQRPRLTRTLREWITSTFAGPYDATYAQRRERIGRVHVQHRLPQRYMVGAMGVVRIWATELCIRLPGGDPEAIGRAVIAVNKILDVELVLMLSTYQTALLAQAQCQGRLATLGALSAAIHHRLRNPLATVSVLCFALGERRSVLADRRAREFVGDVQSSVTEIKTLLDDYLAMSEVSETSEGGADVDAVVRAALGRIDVPSAVQLSVDVDPLLPLVGMPPNLLEQVLVNLIDNALEACEGGEQVGLRARTDGGGVQLEMWDEGEGILESDLNRVFDPLYTTRPERLGLGLTLTRHIVEAVGGTVTITSKRGQGTRVCLGLRT